MTSSFSPECKKAQEIICLEAQALKSLAEQIDSSFDAALQLMHETKGRIIVTGIGKSGHIARKIAATLASTGSASYFVHPSEASHGDLGMISNDDLVIALSNSGETKELSDLIAYTKCFSVHLIAITSKKNSTLSKAAHVSLILPSIQEACSLKLAPTTSTTMMLALGDALAITLMDYKNFSSQDFKKFHPGGRLGSQLMRVQDIMHVKDALPTIYQEDTMDKAILVMTQKTFGCAAVIQEDGRLLGSLTDGDLRRHMHPNLLKKQVKDICTFSPITISSSLLIADAFALMQEKKITSLFVTDNNYLIGLLRLQDCLQAGLINNT